MRHTRWIRQVLVLCAAGVMLLAPLFSRSALAQDYTTTSRVGSSADPSQLNQAVTFSATVSGEFGGTPTGTVTFEANDGTVFGTGTLDGNGDASWTGPFSTPGVYYVKAFYSGDANFYASASNGYTEQDVNGYTSTSRVGSSADPSQLNQAVTFSATVSGQYGGTPTGTVTFAANDGTVYGTGTLDGNGDASWTGPFSTPGVYYVKAFYSGDANFYASASNGYTEQDVNGYTSTSSVNSSLNPSQLNQAVTFSATVSGQYGGTPTGTVTFAANDGTVYGTGTLDGNGDASWTGPFSTPGVYYVKAFYSGDANFYASASNGYTEQDVNGYTSTSSVNSSLNPSQLNQAVIFSATVSGQYGGTPTGTVTFAANDGTVFGTGTLDGNGDASWTGPFSTPGVYYVKAFYSGDANFYTSSSNGYIQQTVNPVAPTSTTLTTSANPSETGQSVTLTATVTGAGVPTGTVTFSDGSTNPATTLGTGTLDGSGVATLAVPFSAAGSHPITGSYVGDANNGVSSSTALAQVVLVHAGTTTTTLTASPSSSSVNQPVTLTAKVTAPKGVVPTGDVTFVDGTTPLGTSALNAGAASLPVSFSTAGVHSLSATYDGSTMFPAETIGILSFIVKKATTITAVTTSANPAFIGVPVTFTAAVTAAYGGTPTGTVTFTSGTTTLGTVGLSAGSATCMATFTSVANLNIKATYSGDANFNTGSGTLKQPVDKDATMTMLSSSLNPSTVGESVTLTATVTGGPGTPTGTVTFYNSATKLGTGTLGVNGDGDDVATWTGVFSTAGSDSLTAAYGGTTTFASSTSPVLAQAVNVASSATSLTAAYTTTTVGANDALTATVKGPFSGTPTGVVVFMDGVVPLVPVGGSSSSVALVKGVAKATFFFSTTGPHTLTAAYQGDSNFDSSSSGSVGVMVNKGAAKTTLTAAPNPAIVNQPVTLNVTVSGTNGVVPTGTVTFYFGNVNLGMMTLDNGSASTTWTPTKTGTDTLTAKYSGDGNFNASSGTVSVTVNTSAPAE